MKIHFDTDAYEFLDVHCIVHDKCNVRCHITSSDQSLLKAAVSAL